MKNTSITIAEIAAAMRAAHYRRHLRRGRWRVAIWHPSNMYPQPMPNTPADRHAMMRYATRLQKIPNGSTTAHSATLWRQIVMLLPAVPSISEFDAANIQSAEESHARFDTVCANLDLIGGSLT